MSKIPSYRIIAYNKGGFVLPKAGKYQYGIVMENDRNS